MTHTERFAEACAEMMLAQEKFHAHCDRCPKRDPQGQHVPCDESMALWREFTAAEERARMLLDLYLATQGVTEQDIRDQIGDDAMEARRVQ